MKNSITVILPAYNEEVSIGSMVLLTRQNAGRVIVIDDGSTDRTSEVARLAGAEVIRFPENKGKGAALKKGFEALVAPILAGEADIVNGANFNSGLAITDTQSGFRAFAAHTVPVFGFRSKGLAIESEMLADAAKAGLRIKEVDISVRYDVEGSNEHPVKHGVMVFMRVLHDMELNKPLYYFTVPGMVFAIAGIGLGMDYLRDFYMGKGLMFGPTLLMILLTLVGTFMTFTGIILHTMSRLIYEVKTKKT